MINCSKRRKTKHPYCSDDPRCYWKGKTCKRKKTKETVSKDNIKKLSKLDIILKKVSIIENYLIEMNKSKKKFLTIVHLKIIIKKFIIIVILKIIIIKNFLIIVVLKIMR